MRFLVVAIFAILATTQAAKLGGHHDHHDDHHHDHHEHDFELATGEESKIANEKINAFFYSVGRSEEGISDVPRMPEIPTDIAFSCEGRLPGYYADVVYDCQVYHTCSILGLSSYLCPNTTVFNQEVFSCDWWFNVDCAAAPNFYHLNEEIYKDPEEEEEQVEIVGEGRREKTFAFGKERVEDPFAAIFQELTVPDETPESSAKVESLIAPEQSVFFIPEPAAAQRREETVSALNDYLPPTKDYLPPANDYLPPSQDYLPPPSAL